MSTIIFIIFINCLVVTYADDLLFSDFKNNYKDRYGNLYSHDKKSNLAAMFLQMYDKKAFSFLIKENAIMRFSIFDYNSKNNGILFLTVYNHSKEKYNLSLEYFVGFPKEQHIIESKIKANINKSCLPLISKSLNNKKFATKLSSLSEFQRNLYTEIGSYSVNTLEYYQDKKIKCIDMNFKRVLSKSAKDFEDGIYLETYEVVCLLNSILNTLNMEQYLPQKNHTR